MAEQADAWSGVPPILLEEIAASIAVAVDHCAAYEELGRLRDEQAALLEVNRTVARHLDRKSTRLNSSHDQISYAVFCLKKKNKIRISPHASRTSSSRLASSRERTYIVRIAS